VLRSYIFEVQEGRQANARPRSSSSGAPTEAPPVVLVTRAVWKSNY